MAIIDSTVDIDGLSVQLLVEGEEAHKSMGRAFGKDRDVGRGTIDRTEDVIGKGFDLATNCARRAVRAIDEMEETVRPDTFAVSFGIRFDAGVGAVITNNRANAQLQVSMTWKKPKES